MELVLLLQELVSRTSMPGNARKYDGICQSQSAPSTYLLGRVRAGPVCIFAGFASHARGFGLIRADTQASGCETHAGTMFSPRDRVGHDGTLHRCGYT